VSDCFERSSSGFFSLVECRLIVYDHGLLLKLLYKFVPHTHTSCVLEKRRAMAREREKACEKSAAARGHFAST
jgi:hypothetical protein